MKRFTDSDIWDKPWFRKAPPRVKELWRYLCEHCDHAGIIDPDWELFSFTIGEPVTEDDLLMLNGNVIVRQGKLFLPGFIAFQYPGLSEDCKPHKPVFEAIERHGIRYSELTGKDFKRYSKGIQSLQDKTRTRSEKDQRRGVGEPTPANNARREIPEAGPDPRFETLSVALSTLYCRPSNAITDGAELHYMAEICRRPDIDSEVEIISSYKQKLPSDERKYFPQSVCRLLERWTEVLDRARNFKAPSCV